MITQNVIHFLKTLKKNNNRDWFQQNRELYNRAKSEIEFFANRMIGEIGQIDREIQSLSARDCIFRIFRDVRFSADKSPYKTHFGIFFVKGGKSSGNAGYYIHIEPEGSFVAGGIHMPLPEILKRVRKEIFENTEEFKSILNRGEFRKHFKGLEGERLIRPPKGFPEDFPDIELLKYKSYTVYTPVDNGLIIREDFIPEIKEIFRAMYPFIRFLNQAITPD